MTTKPIQKGRSNSSRPSKSWKMKKSLIRANLLWNDEYIHSLFISERSRRRIYAGFASLNCQSLRLRRGAWNIRSFLAFEAGEIPPENRCRRPRHRRRRRCPLGVNFPDVDVYCGADFSGKWHPSSSPCRRPLDVNFPDDVIFLMTCISADFSGKWHQHRDGRRHRRRTSSQFFHRDHVAWNIHRFFRRQIISVGLLIWGKT